MKFIPVQGLAAFRFVRGLLGVLNEKLLMNDLELAVNSTSSSSAGTGYTTYASEPQRRVWDVCVSLSDLSELRRALNFPSRAGNL